MNGFINKSFWVAFTQETVLTVFMTIFYDDYPTLLYSLECIVQWRFLLNHEPCMDDILVLRSVYFHFTFANLKCAVPNHAAIFLMERYKQRLEQEAPVQSEVACWIHCKYTTSTSWNNGERQFCGSGNAGSGTGNMLEKPDSIHPGPLWTPLLSIPDSTGCRVARVIFKCLLAPTRAKFHRIPHWDTPFWCCMELALSFTQPNFSSWPIQWSEQPDEWKYSI